MPSRPRVTTAAVTSAAVEVADTHGFEALALTAVAKRLDVAASTLYTHTDGLDSLKYQVAVAATQALTDQVRNAAIGAAGADALHSMAVTYRRFAIDHPGQFASTLLAPRLDEGDPAEDDDLAQANAALLGVFVLVYEGIGLDADEARRAARATRGAIHGFLALEDKLTSASEHDADYLYLLDALQYGLLKTQPS